MLAGSSPLTRGKRTRQASPRNRQRLIPAHAGKTDRAWRRGVHPQAHPRSRGENFTCLATTVVSSGSSPLTRGKPDQHGVVSPTVGLIPAHAGKTRAKTSSTSPSRAHPRSRGENPMDSDRYFQIGGSSPLTRGKPLTRRNLAPTCRLIPAHAGKTRNRLIPPQLQEAHPRSRGENDRCDCRVDLVKGSSPLTRGKLLLECCGRSRTRLIPAHAGKTRSSACLMRSGGAHPRSRGENSTLTVGSVDGGGSSQLTRGKPGIEAGRYRGVRLIPAHAGKTQDRSKGGS